MKAHAPFFASNKFKLGYSNAFVVDCDGKIGGLALLWKEFVHLKIFNYLVHHIHCMVTLDFMEGNRDYDCVLTRVYGHPELTHRLEVWILLCFLGSSIDKPWLIFGNFKKILHVSKKWGSRARFK